MSSSNSNMGYPNIAKLIYVLISCYDQWFSWKKISHFFNQDMGGGPRISVNWNYFANFWEQKKNYIKKFNYFYLFLKSPN